MPAQLKEWLSKCAHDCAPLRTGEMGAQTALSLVILVAFTVVFIPLSIRGMRRRLIK